MGGGWWVGWGSGWRVRGGRAGGEGGGGGGGGGNAQEFIIRCDRSATRVENVWEFGGPRVTGRQADRRTDRDFG